MNMTANFFFIIPLAAIGWLAVMRAIEMGFDRTTYILLSVGIFLSFFVGITELVLKRVCQ